MTNFRKQLGRHSEVSSAIEEKILKIVESWTPRKKPEYREFTCALCKRKIRKAWHMWLNKKGYRIETHFCHKCFTKLQYEVAST